MKSAVVVAVLTIGGVAGGQPAGFVITGRVTDTAGGPVSQTFVTALVPDVREGRDFRPVDVRLHALTSPDGQFRLQLPYAGEFYVVALPHNAPVQGRSVATQGFGNTFHSSSGSASEAKKVRVMPGQPAVADITLLPARLAMISGVVIGSDEQPVPNARVLVAHGDGFFGMDSAGFIAGPDGTFRIGGRQPGTYFLVYRETEWPPPRETIPKISQVKVVLKGADVAGVRVVPLQMVRATGRVVVDPAVRASFPHAAMRVSAFPVPVDGNPGPQRGGQVLEDLTFEFRTWPMPSKVRTSIEASGWTVKAVRLNGADITNKVIDFVQGKDIQGLEVEVTKK